MSTEATQQELSMKPAALQPVLSEQYALTWQQAMVCVVFSGLFMYLNYMPLFHTEVWRHVSLGEWIISNQQLPASNPMVELAAGMDYTSNAWLSQVLMASSVKVAGIEGLSCLLALFQTATLALFTVLFYRLTRSKIWMMAGFLALLAVWWGQLGILRPPVFGGFCLATLMLLLHTAWGPERTLSAEQETPQDNNTKRWLGIASVALVMAVWVNLDSSFIIGMIVVLGFSLGGICRQWNLHGKNLFQQGRGWEFVYLFEIAILATWLNPQGVSVWLALGSKNGANLIADAGGIRPLMLFSAQGLWFALYWVAALWAFRYSKLAIGWGNILVLVGLSVVCALNQLMIVWFYPVGLAILLPHCVNAFANVFPNGIKVPEPEVAGSESANVAKPVSFLFSILTLLVFWIAFALSPISNPLLGGKERSAEVIHNRHTPLVVAEHLANEPDDGIVWAPQYWGDYLQWTSRNAIKPYLNSDTQAVPRQVLDDYWRVYRGDRGWEKALERYAIGTVVIDKKRQPGLLREFFTNGKEWKIKFEDPEVLILARINHTVEGCNCGNEG